MKKNMRVLLLAAASLLLVASAPISLASTLTITLNPASRTATVDSMSTTDMVLTYPADSMLSQQLRNFSSSIARTGSFSDSDGAMYFQRWLDSHDGSIRVLGLNVSYTLQGKGNDTALVIHKVTEIKALVTGLFHVSNGTVVADMGWKAYRIDGAFDLNLGGHYTDINTVGSAWGEQLQDHPYMFQGVYLMFGAFAIWQKPTLDFSNLNASLSTWTKNYNSATNQTTFTKTISGHSTVTASLTNNGQTYTLKETSDPTANVVTPGYASASGDSLVIQPGSGPMGPGPVWTLAALVALAVVAGAVFLGLRTRKPSPARVGHVGQVTG
jgi:hypothetical protein